MKKTSLDIVRIVALICLAILFGCRKDYPVASILFIVAIAEIAGLVGRSAKKRNGQHSFVSSGAEDVRKSFESIGNAARDAASKTTKPDDSPLFGESETARKFRIEQAESRRKMLDLGMFAAIPTTKITTEMKANSTSTTMHYTFVPKKSDESSINPLPADPPTPNSPSE